VRLTICVLLAKHDTFSFTRLKTLLDETDGSLGAHLRKLDDGGYLAVEKTYRERRPVTWFGSARPGGHTSVAT
jgi:hypothetical protein